MIHVILSDHTQKKLNEAKQKRMAPFDEAVKKMDAKMAPWMKFGKSIDAKAIEAFKRNNFIAWLFLRIFRFFFDIFYGFFIFDFVQVPEESPEEAILRAGNLGEQLMKEKLSGLPDDFVLVSGYKNRKGEIDQILVGPRCVLCIEIKHYSGNIFSDGDQWWRDKYNKHGDLVERNAPIVDGGGRGPSAQVNAAADDLEAYLRKYGLGQRVCRAVVFTHEKSELVFNTNRTVDIITDLKSFAIFDFLEKMSRTANEVYVTNAVAMIERDHAFHEQNSARYRSRFANGTY